MLTHVSRFVLGVLLMTVMTACSDVLPHDVYVEYYAGSVTAYNVTYAVNISEKLNSEDGFMRIVNMDRVRDPQMRRITGHGGNAGAVYDLERIFYCGPRNPTDKVSGCNAVERTGGAWMFIPCPADKANATPFTKAEINEAASLLNLAVLQVRTPEHLTEQWAWDSVQQKVNRIYSLSEHKAGN